MNSQVIPRFLTVGFGKPVLAVKQTYNGKKERDAVPERMIPSLSFVLGPEKFHPLFLPKNEVSNDNKYCRPSQSDFPILAIAGGQEMKTIEDVPEGMSPETRSPI